MNSRFAPRARRRWKVATAIAVALAFAAAGCSSDSDSTDEPQGGGDVDKNATVRVGVDFLPTNWDPIQNTGNQGAYTLPEVYDQLLQLDEDLQPEAMLATSWEYNADGTELTMKLRDDAVFNGSGSPVNAEAVAAGFERAQTDPKSLVASQLDVLTGVDAVDDTTVKFTFSQPSYSFVADLAADPKISSVVDPTASTDSLVSTPAGSGPYTLEDAAQAKIVFTRVAEHWDETSGLAKTLEFQAIPDENARFNAVKAGQLDVTLINSGQSDAAKQMADTGQFQTVYEPKVQKYILRVNGTDGRALSDPDIRLAISKSIDRTSFCETVFGDMATPSRQPFVLSNPGYDEALDDDASLTAQTDEAKSLLADAGANDLTISILALAGSTINAEVLQQQLADVGITLKIETQASYPALISGWLTGDYDTGIVAEDATWDPGSMIKQSIATNPISGGLPDYVAAAVDKANSAPIGDERDAAFAEVNETLTEQPVNIPLCDVGLGLLGSSKVVGLDTVRFLGFAPPFEIRRLGLTD